ncbi:MAG: hypothetical protein ACO248_10665, partial [Burkholderiaceae bacterium]
MRVSQKSIRIVPNQGRPSAEGVSMGGWSTPGAVSSGTAAAPALTFASDTDTGIYRKSANTIGVACGGSEVAAISSSGIEL